jgi:hypothetical protein
MSKAEDLAKEFLKKLVSHATLYKGTIDELEVYEPDDVIWAYKEGYHQAEKDNELTWKDIEKICLIAKEVHQFRGFWCEIVYQEVLKRFKDLKERKEK